ncbi:MAG: hypothetical protein AAB506_00960 [Patescibacteria group bacterium]
MKKLQKEIDLKKDKRSYFLTVIILLIFGFVSIVRIAVANRLVEASDRLHNLEVRENILAVQNQKLSQEVRQTISLNYLEQKAKSLGLVSPQKVLYL